MEFTSMVANYYVEMLKGGFNCYPQTTDKNVHAIADRGIPSAGPGPRVLPSRGAEGPRTKLHRA